MTSIVPLGPTTAPRSATRRVGDRAARRAGSALLARISEGSVVVQEGERLARHGAGPPEVTVSVHDPATWGRVLGGGSTQLGLSYVDGGWDADDLTGFLRLLIRNLRRVDRVRNRLRDTTGAGRLVDGLAAARRQVDKVRDRENIAAHYDLSNEFFDLLLDDTMTYSSARFDGDPDRPLAEAQAAKYDRLCTQLGLAAHHHVLEIGTGWGGFAEHAARTTGCRVTTTTISAEQEAYARARIEAAGLSDRVTVLGEDYRDLTGTYDRVVSIEMIEAVDWREHATFFATVDRLLADDGAAAIQAITITDQRYERAKHTQDFIKSAIFPGGCLPSVTRLVSVATEVSSLVMTDLDDFGSDYALTLRRWDENLQKHRHRLDDLGFDDRLARLFEFYLAYCEAAFLERHVSVVQATFAKPAWRP